MRYKIIVNPISGRGNGERLIPQIESTLSSYNVEFDLVRTEHPWQAAEIASQACLDGYEGVIAAGGDGTANEVINGLIWSKEKGAKPAALGVLSIGRGNDFAFGMGIPAGVQKGCEVLAQGKRSYLDIGRVIGGDYPNGRYFGNGVGIGFDAVVGFEALKMKRLHGFASYLVAALKTIFLYYKAPRVRIQYDSEEIELSALMVSIMNGRRMGGGFMMAPYALTDDSLFDLCIASQVSRLKIFALIPKFMKGTQAGNAAIRTLQTRQVTVIALSGSLPAHADGETLCHQGQQLVLEVLPRELEIIKP